VLGRVLGAGGADGGAACGRIDPLLARLGARPATMDALTTAATRHPARWARRRRGLGPSI